MPRRGCAVLLTVLVSALVSLVGARPAAAVANIAELGETMLYFTASDGLTRVGAYGYQRETFPVADPASVTLDEDGTVYVAGGLLVREFQPDDTWGPSLFPDLSSASDVAARDGRLVVADAAGSELKVKNPGDGPAATLASDVHPTRVVTTAAGSYFLDDGDVYRYTSEDGVQPVRTGTPATSLAADTDGKLYLGEATRIVKYDPEADTGTDLVTGLDSAPVDLAVSESGDLYYASDDGVIKRLARSEWQPTTIVTGADGLTAIAVRTLPRMPAVVSAEAGDRKADVFWGASETNGGPSDIRYEVDTFVGDEIGEPVPADVPVCATRQTSCTITDLENGKYYTFKVTAFNTADGNDTGSSMPNESNGVYARVVPDAPVLGTPTPGNEAASVTFTAGADNGVPTTAWMISTDRLQWRGAGIMQTSESEFEAVFENLVNDQTNTLYVRAFEPRTEISGAVASTTVTPDSSLPGVPALSDVRPGEKSATLIFPPANQGDSPITGYEASVNNAPWTPVDVNDGSPDDDESPPAEEPSAEPSESSAPVEEPSAEPSEGESSAPAEEPSAEPSESSAPAEEPSAEPSESSAPAEEPSAEPSESESSAPAEEPSESSAPAEEPSAEPSESSAPAEEPSAEPSESESSAPAEEPSEDGAQVEGEEDVPDGMLSVVFPELTQPANLIRLRARNSQGVGVYAATMVFPTQVVEPGAPRFVEVHSGDERLIVTFVASQYPADAYQVQIGEGEWSPLTLDNVDPGSQRGVIGGLVNGQTYEIRVRGVNQVGPGEASEPMSGTPARRPSAPRAAQAVAGDTTVRLSFLPAADDGGDPAHLTYDVSLDGGESWEPLTTEPGMDGALTATISGLVNDEPVSILLWAYNSGGPSDTVALSATPTATPPPTTAPTSEPTSPATTAPTSEPTSPATTAPTSEPTSPATTAPTSEPPASPATTAPTSEPTSPATTAPTSEPPTSPATTAPTSEPTTPPTTPAPTTPAPTSQAPATTPPTTPAPTAQAPTAPAPTSAPTTPAPITPAPTSAPPTSAPPTSAPPTSAPATSAPATSAPTSAPQTTAPTTAPTTPAPTATAPTTPAPTTAPPTTPAPVPPNAPTGVTATAGLASITVSWNAPPGNGAVITGYRATVSPGGATCTSSGTSCVVGGDPGTAYTVSVVALSAAGASPNSASSNAATPEELPVPDAPPAASQPLETPDGPVTSAAPGGRLKMSGRGYAPFSVVTLAVYSEPTVLGTVTADAEGAFETEIEVPDDLSLGTHSFVAAGVDKNGKFRALRLDLTVAEHSAGDTTLPVTGSALLWLFVAGFASVVTGAAIRRFAS